MGEEENLQTEYLPERVIMICITEGRHFHCQWIGLEGTHKYEQHHMCIRVHVLGSASSSVQFKKQILFFFFIVVNHLKSGGLLCSLTYCRLMITA